MEKIKLEKKEIRLSRTAIDETLWKIQTKMWKKVSVNDSYSCMRPLTWYVDTGRATCEFLKLLINTSEREKSTIANRLVKMDKGDYRMIITNICNYIGYNPEAVAQC